MGAGSWGNRLICAGVELELIWATKVGPIVGGRFSCNSSVRVNNIATSRVRITVATIRMLERIPPDDMLPLSSFNI